MPRDKFAQSTPEVEKSKGFTKIWYKWFIDESKGKERIYLKLNPTKDQGSIGTSPLKFYLPAFWSFLLILE